MARAFGKYRLSRRIGVGATAEVFEATREDGRPVVLKRILPQRASHPQFRELFEREARIVRELSHPNVVTLLDFGEIEHTYYLALEKVDGGDLATLLEHGGSPGPELAALIARELACALAYVHSQSGPGGVLCHRDVSPENVLLSQKGEVKLADFGIAKHGGDTATEGKDPYLAPECETAGGSFVQAGPPADVYALGALLREMLGNARTLAFDALLARALATDPKDRPTAAEMMRALDEHLARLPRRPTADDLGKWVARAIVAETQDGVDLLARALLGEVGIDRPSTAVFAAAHHAGESIEDETLLVQMKKEPIRVSLPVFVLSIAATAVISALATYAIVSSDPPEVPPPPLQPAKTIAVSPILLEPEPPVMLALEEPKQPPAIAPEPERRRRPQKKKPAAPPPEALAKKADDALQILLGAAPEIERAKESTTATVVLDEAPEEAIADEPPEPEDPPSSRTPAKRRPREFGTLSINSIPWANVFVDGELVGATPLETTVTAGRHRIVLRSKNGKVIKEFTTEVGPGDHRVHSFDDGTR